MKKMELLAPAGDLEKLKIAIDYGADAVYFGGPMFGLRAGAGNLNIEEMKEGLDYAHARGAKAYMTVNVFAHNEDIKLLPGYLHEFFTDLCIYFIKILRACLIQFSFDRNGIIKHYYAHTHKYNYCHTYCCKEIFAILILLQLTSFLSQDNQLFCI